ncbi:diguanylate cyclase [Rheinheimera metallidurans]|uniref:tetratricopeptide repeat-containing diguanylate cyclase n=1 Tax=Rheinheimera metallidurans TaxID=2925781 RepID=UPI00300299D7
MKQLPSEQRDHFIFIKAYMLGFKGQQDDAIALAQTIIKSQSAVIRVKAYLLLATVFEHKKNYKEAYLSLNEALKHARIVTDRMLLVNVYTVAAQLHSSVNAYEKAIEFADMIAEYADSPRGFCISYTQKLQALTQLVGAYPQELANKASLACEQAQEPLMKYTVDIFTADVDVNSAPERVKKNMQASLPKLNEIGYLYTIILTRYYLGYAELNLNQLSAAEVNLEQVYQQSKQLNDNQTANKSMLLLARLYEKKGDMHAAVIAYKQHIAALNAFIGDFKQRSVAYHMAQADFMESENKLALLKSQNNLLKLESQLQKDQKFNALLITIAVTLLLLCVIYVLNNKRALLSRLATTDFLTKLYNRRYFSEAVSRQLNNRRQQEEYSLIVFDIDLFKQINDQYGHSTGDIVLTEIAARCSVHIRKQDILARIGGEEFAMFLPGCRLADAIKLAEQCRQSIADSAVVVNEQNISVTASFGIASGDSANFDTLLQQADAALYQAKAAGRNCSHSATANA